LQDWEPTNDYEIVEKKSEESELKDCVHVFDSCEDAREFIKNRVEPRKTPNCAVCRWKVFKKPELINDEPITYITEGICSAIGYMPCRDCYNTDECKALFEPKMRNEILSEKDASNLIDIASQVIKNNPIAIRHILEAIEWIGKMHSEGCNLKSFINRTSK
jgi:hypothetical protein